MTQDQNVFKLDGLYTNSAQIPTIITDGVERPRADFWQRVINAEIARIPSSAVGTQPVYIATGGGYGSFDQLVDHERRSNMIAAKIPSIKGDLFRDLPEFAAEKDRVREQIRTFLGEENLAKNPDAVEQTLSAFYSAEVNTSLAKAAVNASFPAGKSVIHESASIYQDTLDRANAAKANGFKTVLLAGDRDLAEAIAELTHIEPQNTATAYQRFADRFNRELVPAFDEVRLYNVDGENPALIAEKKGPGQQLEVYNHALYTQFIAKAAVDPKTYASITAGANVIKDDNEKIGEQERKDNSQGTETDGPGGGKAQAPEQPKQQGGQNR